MTVPLPPPSYPAILAIVLATVWLEDASPKRRKAFFERLRVAITRHRAGERPMRMDRPSEEAALADVEVEKAFAYVEAWVERAIRYLPD